MKKGLAYTGLGLFAGVVISQITTLLHAPPPKQSSIETPDGDGVEALSADIMQRLSEFDVRLDELARQMALIRETSFPVPSDFDPAADLDRMTITVSKTAIAEIQEQMESLDESRRRIESAGALALRGVPPDASERLLDAGFTQQRIDWINRRIDEISMETLRTRYEAERVGEELPDDTSTVAMKLLAEMGEAEYERYLTALGMPTTLHVRQVLENSPAQQGGLRAGDELVSYQGKRVFSMPQLEAMIRDTRPGTPVVLEVRRDGQTQQLVVQAGPLGVSASLLQRYR